MASIEREEEALRAGLAGSEALARAAADLGSLTAEAQVSTTGSAELVDSVRTGESGIISAVETVNSEALRLGAASNAAAETRDAAEGMREGALGIGRSVSELEGLAENNSLLDKEMSRLLGAFKT